MVIPAGFKPTITLREFKSLLISYLQKFHNRVYFCRGNRMVTNRLPSIFLLIYILIFSLLTHVLIKLNEVCNLGNYSLTLHPSSSS